MIHKTLLLSTLINNAFVPLYYKLYQLKPLQMEKAKKYVFLSWFNSCILS